MTPSASRFPYVYVLCETKHIQIGIVNGKFNYHRSCSSIYPVATAEFVQQSSNGITLFLTVVVVVVVVLLEYKRKLAARVATQLTNDSGKFIMNVVAVSVCCVPCCRVLEAETLFVFKCARVVTVTVVKVFCDVLVQDTTAIPDTCLRDSWWAQEFIFLGCVHLSVVVAEVGDECSVHPL